MFQLKNKKFFKTIQSKWNQLEEPEQEWAQLDE
jgi:hypothetical protein